PIGSPADLPPTLSALITTIGVTSIDPPSEEAPPSRTAGTAAPVAPPDAITRTSAAPGASNGHVALGGAVGARWGSPNRVLGPIFEVPAGLALSRWELGVYTELAPFHASSFNAPDDFRMWSAGAGIAVGARLPAGTFSLVTGVRLGAGVVSETATAESDA